MSDEITAIQRFARGEAGVYRGISAIAYHALSAVSSSTLKRIHLSTPMHARAEMLAPSEPSDEMNIGAGAHCMKHTPEVFDSEFVCSQQCSATVKSSGDRCKNAGVKLVRGGWLCVVHGRGLENEVPDGQTVLTPDDYRRVKGIHKALWDNNRVRRILEAATDFELSILFADPATQLLVKCRIDILCADIGIMPDLKTCRSVRYFAEQAWKLAYHIQLALYRRMAIVSGIPVDLPTIIGCENEEPFDVAVFEPTKQFMDEGVSDLNAAMNTFADCHRTGIWPGYSDKIVSLDVPRWMKQ